MRLLPKETENAPQTSTRRTSRRHRAPRSENRGRGQGGHPWPRAGSEDGSRGSSRHTREGGSPPPDLAPGWCTWRYLAHRHPAFLCCASAPSCGAGRRWRKPSAQPRGGRSLARSDNGRGLLAGVFGDRSDLARLQGRVGRRRETSRDVARTADVSGMCPRVQQVGNKKVPIYRHFRKAL